MKIIIKYSSILLVLGSFASCKKYLDVNTNPNAGYQASNQWFTDQHNSEHSSECFQGS